MTSQPFKTSAFFLLAIAQSSGRTWSSVLKKGSWLKIVVLSIVATWGLLLFTDGPHEKVSSSKVIRTSVFHII
jgi:vacuole membrane protein 1